MKIGLDAAEILIAVAMAFGMTALAIIGYLIRDSISNFRKSIENLDQTIENLDKTINEHHNRISELEYKMRDDK